MTRRRRSARIAAGFAALVALTGGLVFAGSLAAQADGGLEFDPALDGAELVYDPAGVTFSGTSVTEGTPTVDVWLPESETFLCSSPIVDTAWACTAVLPPGAYPDVTAVQEVSPGVQVQDVVGIVVVPPPVGWDQSSPYTVAADDLAPFSGTTTAPDALVEVTVTGLGSCSTTVIATPGPWSCSIGTGGASAGDYAVQLRQVSGGQDSIVSGIVRVAEAVPFEILGPLPSSSGYVSEWRPDDSFAVFGTAPDDSSLITIDLDDTPFCSASYASETAWECTGQPWPDPGEHSLAVTRGTGTPLTRDFTVILPAPLVDETVPGSVPPGAGTFAITGTTTYPGAATRMLLHAGHGEVQDPMPLGPATQCTTAGTSYSCAVDVGALDAGDYTAHLVHHLPAQPTVQGAVTEFSFVVTDSEGAAAPTLDCVFTPGGGVTISSAQTFSVLSVYRVGPAGGSESASTSDSGGGASGGGGEGSFGLPGYCGGLPGTPHPSGLHSFELVADDCLGGCSIAGLPPGLYEIYHTVSDAEPPPNVSLEPHSFLFTVPEAPDITTTAISGQDVVLSGSGKPGDTVHVVRANGATLCTTTVTGGGSWSCAFPTSSASIARAIAVDPSGAMSPYSPARVIPERTTPVSPPDVTTQTPPFVAWLLQFHGDLSNLAPGDTFTLQVTGMPVGTEIEVWMHSTPRLIGTATGTGLPMTLELTVPDDIEPGPHEIEMIGTTPSGTQYVYRSGAIVMGAVEPAVDEAVVDDPADEPAPETAGDVDDEGPLSADRSDPGAASALSESIAPLQRILENPVSVAVAGGLALALLFLVALPTELLNSSLSSNTSRLGRMYGAVENAMTRAQDWFIRVTRSRALAAAALVVVISIVYGFVDPAFGLDLVSLRLVLSLAIAFFLLTFVASRISGLIIHRAWGASGVVALQPSVILFAVVGVVVARILEFSPGFLVGIAIGLELIQASRRVSARAVLVQFLVVVGLALAAWVVYSFVTPERDFLGMLLGDTLVAITAEGLTGALIAVFPLQFFDGRELWLESKRLWVGAFLLVAIPFALLVLPTAIEGTEVSDYGVWLLVCAVFAALSLAIWFVFARAARREETAERVDA